MLNDLPPELISFIATKIESSDCLISFAKTNKYIYHCVKNVVDVKVQSVFPDVLLKFVELKFQDRISVEDFKAFKRLSPASKVSKEAVTRAYVWALRKHNRPLINALIKDKYFDTNYINEFLGNKEMAFKCDEIKALRPLYENKFYQPKLTPTQEDLEIDSFQL